MQNGVVSIEVVKSDENGLKSDLLAVEEPLQIRVNFGILDDRREIDLSVTMRTPGHDPELAAGFLLTEGIIGSLNDFIHLGHCRTHLKKEEAGNVVRVELKPGFDFVEENFNRNFYSTSSCGVCGIGSIEQIRKKIPPLKLSEFHFDSEMIKELPGLIKNSQVNFSYTGGIHAAALVDANGKVSRCREDIGRHNAVDKVIGASFLGGQYPISKELLFLSGRAGFELIQKAAMAGIQLVAAVGAPSSLAVELAKECKMTLLGFVRDGKFNIYSGKQRIAS